MSTFLQPSVYGPMGVSSDTQNAMLSAAAFVSANRAQLETLLMAPSVTRQWHAMQVVGSTQISANRWEYVLRKSQPIANGQSLTYVAVTELTEVTAYNLAEYGNTAATAAGGVDAVRANAQGFVLLPVPDDAFVHAFLMYKSNGESVALFERMNAFDGECVAALLASVDGGNY